MELRGESGIESVVIMLHRSGRYSMAKAWKLTKDQTGISGLGEPGTYAIEDGVITLVSDFSVKRILTPDAERSFIVEEHLPDGPDRKRYSLEGWKLTAVDADKR
jgi:hypothetical protein